MATARTLIKRAYRKIIPGGTDDPQELKDGLEELNSLIAAMSAQGILVPNYTQSSFSLSTSSVSYTFGTAGTASSTRAKQIMDAFVRDAAALDHPVTLIGENEYNDVSSKSSTGRPRYLWYDGAYPVGTAYVWPKPNAVETLHYTAMNALTAISGIGSDVNMPGEYEDYFVYNLAVRLAPELGKSVSAEVGVLAANAESVVMALNASNKMNYSAMPAGMPGLAKEFTFESG